MTQLTRTKINNEEWWLEHNMIPHFNCPHLEKLGGKGHEGTKFVCNPQRLVHDDDDKNANDHNGHKKKKDCLIYSVVCGGNGGDFLFEDAIYEMHGKGCETHIFDPADWTRKGDVENKNIHYHAWGIKSSYDAQSKSIIWPAGRRGDLKTFQETLKRLGHENRTIDIFKIDCEGCEYSTHKDWIGFGARQILLEIHGVPQPQGGTGRWYQKAMNVSEYYKDFLDNGYALFSRDPNGALGLELSFIKLHQDFWKRN
eukprot:CAMPEP_0172507560 /NCGR_PEP_ID=MMETSP1066-20121228/204629_1 /TAXON_ID=671091 /ORGANISM="Coscinodiscus wailesii, Strain CCMP2513" /LENGTH=254 /DNA_ID=CAMNT_0013285143 /DNA_START=496 /DNA_END=1260 /DNA_ORIENTATION=+